MFTGCGTALVTPFRRDLSLDEPAMRKLVRRQIDAGIDFLVPCGTTGESPTLTERRAFARRGDHRWESLGPRSRAGRSGGYNTAESSRWRRNSNPCASTESFPSLPITTSPRRKGCTGISRPSLRPFRFPLIVYNVPRRTGINVEPATLKRLAEIDNIVGVKEASGDIGQIASILGQVAGEIQRCFRATMRWRCPLIALGGQGLISVVSNEIPAEMTELVQLVPAR